MIGEEFVKLCFEEKESFLREYFSINSETWVAKKIQLLTKSGVDKDELYELINQVLTDNYYNLLLTLDGEASLHGKQVCYKLYDEDDNRLNECGELEVNAYQYFIEE